MYDKAGRRVASIDPLGNQWTTEYGPTCEPEATENPLGERNENVYDPGRQAGGHSGPAWPAHDERLRSGGAIGGHDRSARDVRSSTVYDEVGRPIAAIDPLGSMWTTVYDEAGQGSLPESIRSGTRTTTVYDEAGPRDRDSRSAGQPQHERVHDAGNQVAQVNPLGYRTTNIFDAANRPVAVSIRWAIGRRRFTMRRASDGFDRRAGQPVTRPCSTRPAEPWPMSNPLGCRATRSTMRPAETSHRSIRWAIGRRPYTTRPTADRAIDPLGQRMTTVFDAAGRRVEATVDRLGYRTTYAHDAAGRRRDV